MTQGLLFHMLFDYMIVRALPPVGAVFGRLPPRRAGTRPGVVRLQAYAGVPAAAQTAR